MDAATRGYLLFQVTSTIGLVPIENARIQIFSQENPEEQIEEITTDVVGRSETIELPAPIRELSLNPGDIKPYAEYNYRIVAEGYEPVSITGSEILADTTAIQPVQMNPIGRDMEPDDVDIPDHTLYGDYPEKIPEAEVKPMDESGEIVLSRVVIPEYIVVHDGVPSNSAAKDYYVRYTDYIKNVVSSEIYATWPESTLYANILAIMSFTLNRVYTEWYRNQWF